MFAIKYLLAIVPVPTALLKAFYCEALAKYSNLFAKVHLRKAAAALVALRVAHNPERAGPNGWVAALRRCTSVKRLEYLASAPQNCYRF